MVKIAISKSDFDMAIIPDDSPDASYLEQEGFEERLAEYRRGDFHFIGVRAVVEIEFPSDNGTITTRVESPGLWGIESDSGDDYFREVFREESETLRDMLDGLEVEVSD